MVYIAEVHSEVFMLRCGRCDLNIAHPADSCELPALLWTWKLVKEAEGILTCDNDGCGARNDVDRPRKDYHKER